MRRSRSPGLRIWCRTARREGSALVLGSDRRAAARQPELGVVSLRHALRVGLVAIPAVAISVIWAGPYQHWLTITWVLTMQPHFAMTITRALERIVGTIIGGVIAAGIVVVAHTPLTMAATIFPLAVTAMAVRQVSFGLFITAVTPLVVILSELGQTGASGWEIAGCGRCSP